MAEQLKLIVRKDLAADGSPLDDFDLLPYLESGYMQKIEQDAETVEESLALVAPSGGDDDDLAELAQEIDRMVRVCQWSKNAPATDQVWLRAQHSSETNARQAYLQDLKRDGAVLHDVFKDESVLHDYALTWKRMAAWEDTALVEVLDIDTDTLATDGTAITEYEITGGDQDARIARLKLGSGSEGYIELWIGIRSRDDYGITGDLEPALSLHTASGLGTATATGSDADALDGTTVITTMTGNETLEMRVQMRLENAVTTPANQIGRYTVLLRAHCTGTLEARVRLRHGLFASLAANQLQRVVTSTNYRLYPMGSIVIPPAYLPPTASLAKTMFLMDAEWASGSGTLVMDALILIPEERMIHIATTQQPDEIYTLPDGTVLGLYTVGGLPTGALDVEPSDWGAARGECMVVCAGATYPDGDSVKGDEIPVGMEVYGRWDTLRGDATTITAPA